MRNIVQIGENVLRGKAQEVKVSDISGTEIQKILLDMKEALDNEPDGAALAAPQIGVSLRIFILSERVFGKGSAHASTNKSDHLVFINPTITKRSGKKELMDEGCLSVRGQYGNIKRSKNVTIEAYDEFGKRFTRGAGGLMAQAFQHECDHLEGTLFIDGAQETWEVEIPKKNSEK
jgi:peptide deformylase